MTPKYLDDLSKVAREATRGPWRQLDQYIDCDVGPLPIATGWYEHATMEGGIHHDAAVANARFISTFDPPTVESLLAEIRSLTARADAAEASLIAERDDRCIEQSIGQQQINDLTDRAATAYAAAMERAAGIVIDQTPKHLKGYGLALASTIRQAASEPRSIEE